MLQENIDCEKSVQIRSFFLVRIFLYSDRIHENTDQKKLRIWTDIFQSKSMDWFLYDRNLRHERVIKTPPAKMFYYKF